MPRGRHWQRGVDVSCGSHVKWTIYMCVETKVWSWVHNSTFLGYISIFCS
jgi:hypothetical protein